MAYQELIKNFTGIRDYMREFAVYGFKSREEFPGSGRSYDDSRRRIESWLGEHVQARRTADGKTVSLSIDTRIQKKDPLYKAWKSGSFTDGDITLHFILFDILHDPCTALTLQEILTLLDEKYLSSFREPLLFDMSTVRKKLREYEEMGLLVSEKQGKKLYYRRSVTPDLTMWQDVLDFFAESTPCGVIGSFLTDRLEDKESVFTFKHHYIAHTLDSDILARIFDCISTRRECVLQIHSRRTPEIPPMTVVPLRIFISAQSGRQYLMAYSRKYRRIMSFRLDYILDTEPGETAGDFAYLRDMLESMQAHMWGVSAASDDHPDRVLEEVTFTVTFSDSEEHIYTRLTREKRCGQVERLDRNTARFTASVYDSNEMVPWIRTFLCRITEIHFSNPIVDRRFREDIEAMYALYGIGGDSDAFS